MYTPKWNIGIDLYQNKIQLVAVKQHRKYWSLCECWQHTLPFDIDEGSEYNQRPILLEIFMQWRQKLPKNSLFSIALPTVRTLKQQIALPTQMNLQQPELGWYIQNRAEKLFPIQAQELAIDYRIINQHAYLHSARKSDIIFWQNLFNECGFNLIAIDIAPIALRYVARHCQLPDECWLIHYRLGEWLWSGPINQPANYNHINENEIATLSQLLQLISGTNPLNLPVYCISDHHETIASPTLIDHQNTTEHITQNKSHCWDLRQAFHQYNLKLPQKLGDFVVAAGLALRHGDI